MKINFKKLKMFGFLSFGDAEIDLNDKGYCLVSGVNRNPKDLAESNGSGKSSIWSAICWALTGETIQGLKSNIVNINIDNGCFVELTFSIDKDEYVLTRYKEYKPYGTDMKLSINGVDKSGKGIKETSEILNTLLPDLTSELIGSVIILGQGLPHKFTDNTPSGRKEVLEKLSKSDYMIEDIKSKLTTRKIEVSNKIRAVEDDILKSTTLKSSYESSIVKLNDELSSIDTSFNYNEEINKLNKELCELETSCNDETQLLNHLQEDFIKLQNDNMNLSQQKENDLRVIEDKYRDLINKNDEELITSSSKLNELNKELYKLENITDVCPTCGQKIPNVIKPDTSNLKASIKLAEDSYNNIRVKRDSLYKDKSNDIENVNNDFSNKLTNIKAKLNSVIDNKTQTELELNKLNRDVYNLKLKVNTLENDRTTLESRINSIKKSIEDYNKSIVELSNKILYNNYERDSLKDKDEVLTKMTTLVNRDFRGYLLKNVIDFINIKAKEYCSYIFDTNELDITLDKNNIDITFCNKVYENLSGGEKQKVDLILQFSLRDMLSQYMNFSSNILILDEIFDNLDSLGCTNVLNLISNKFNDIESIFIISHHINDLSIPNDSEIVVEKNEEGISRIK